MISHLRDLLGDPWTVAFTALRVAAIYGILLVLLQLAGRRVLGQMTSFDLLTLLLLSNAVQNAMIGPDNSLLGGVLGALVLLGLNRLISRSGLRKSLETHNLVLINNGQVIAQHLQMADISEEELGTALREHGVSQASEVSMAYLEPDGTISVIPFKEGTVKRLRRVKSSRNR